ncbi:5-oxoprolinase subunit PxpA [Vitreoscilla massiliensis]|uniref:5-oxoprolinase subunit PxpA n=1 Tax=Vitreoscilla massiliensis TaxID=1689272 RepID=A0ABY4E382_9NEIS|nr:5-oxoprolinase subunit PxpA [Vitreoscilla massiliensis]UOO89734.1 5-oxoprolinase subunit PxpA [Vitreoscilla massiliensis]
MSKQFIDLNSDMGEGFGPWKAGDGTDDEIIQLISSANIATGFHAGDPNIMAKTVQLAKEHSVGIGAHPGYRDLVGFGRRTINASHQELINDIVYQMGSLSLFAKYQDLPIQHVKPHGALYMTLASDLEFSKQFVEVVQKLDPNLLIFCMDVSATYKAAQALGMKAVREFYGDRHYDDSGSIVFTRQQKALEPQAVAEKVLEACVNGRVKTVQGNWIPIEFDSVCIHSDTPRALELIRATKISLEQENITIANQFAS